MVIWGALLIPLAAAAWLYFFHRDEVTVGEFLVILAVGFGGVGLSKLLVEKVATSDTEYWTGWATAGEYYEDWDERVSCRHTKYCSRPDGKGGTERYSCGTEHLYDVDYHPAYWQVVDSNGIAVAVGEGHYKDLGRRWGATPRFVELNRNYHTDDGDKYVVDWPKTDETLEVVTTSHTYENRVQASTSVFNFPEVENPSAKGLYDYPSIGGAYNLRSILGNGGPTMGEAERILSVTNAKLGRKKQVRAWVLVFQGKSLETAMDQEAYWKRGNKNEFVLCVGTDAAGAVTWAYAFSWTEVESLKVQARDQVMDQAGGPLDLVPVVDWLGAAIERDWVRKPFADFSYLTVEPPGWAVIVAYLVNAIVSAVVSLWATNNRIRDYSHRAFGRYGSY